MLTRHPLQADCFCLVASPAVSTEPLLSAMAQRTPAASADDVRIAPGSASHNRNLGFARWSQHSLIGVLRCYSILVWFLKLCSHFGLRYSAASSSARPRSRSGATARWAGGGSLRR